MLPSGYYTVTVEAAGFKRFLKSRNKLDPNVATTVDVDLAVGAITESVEVVAAAAQVQSETATVGKLIESTLLDNIQMNGRNPIYLALLKPGVPGAPCKRSTSLKPTEVRRLTVRGLSTI